MKKVFIKYNPYNLETEFTVDGKNLPENSKIRESIIAGLRLQEWVEDLPDLLIGECNDNEFDVDFHGTLLDYEDLNEVFTNAVQAKKLTVRLNRIPAKETSDKEVLIDSVFDEIRHGPFEELKDVEIMSAFEHEKSSDFEVCVVATMSAGKSTLINSMLGTKLMPSKQEACTAIITKIKDTDGDEWQAEVYGKDNQLIEPLEKLTYRDMERLNGDERVSVIKATGNIPFVTADDISLVLIDTPGPNNSRDPEHRKIQSQFLSKSSKSLVLYIMEGTFGSDDDNALLQRVADSMKVKGKQSKDRFIFVVNKMDDRRNEDGETEQTLDKVREYLKGHGIVNPNLFPAAALPALNIRLLENGVELDVDTSDETEMKVRKLNRNEYLHLEEFACLPASVGSKIKTQLNDAIEKGDKNAEALIHTGVPSIEAAISQYVRKYAKTAKIKNIVDTFMHKLDEVSCFEQVKKELAKRREDSKRIAETIENVNKKIDDFKSAQKFEKAVDDAVVKVCNDAEGIVENIISKYQSKITEKIDGLRGEELDVSEVDDEITRLERFAKKTEENFQDDLDELIQDNLVNTSNALLNEYKNKLASLMNEFDSGILGGITIDPLKLMAGSIPTSEDFSVKKLIKTKEVEDGQELVKNENKKWWKPWTWFQDKYVYKTKYKTVKYVPANELAQKFFAPMQDNLLDNGENALKHAKHESNRIARSFNAEFERLDKILKNKLSELESYAKDEKLAEQRIKECEKRLKWLEDIKAKVDSILEI